MKQVRLLVLDLDGTVRHGKNELGRFVNGPADVIVFPEAIALMKRWRSEGGRIIGASNQGGVALGITSESQVLAAIHKTQEECYWMFDAIAVCPHHPKAGIPQKSQCWCRKPKPGLVITTATSLALKYHEEYPGYMGLMVGDLPTDKECADHLGFNFQWAHEWRAQA